MTSLALAGLAVPALVPAAPATGLPEVLPLAVSSDDDTTPQVVAEVVAQALEDQGEALVVAPDAAAAPPSEPAPLETQEPDSTVERLDLEQAGGAQVEVPDPAGQVEAYVSEALPTESFSVAGVTWEGGTEPARVLARTYQDGDWSEWYDLEVDDGGPQPDSDEAAAAAAAQATRQSTGVLIAPEAEAIQIQVLSQPGAALPEGIGTAVVPDAAVDAAGTASTAASSASTTASTTSTAA
ncbi:MAG: hypothetical protein LBR19_00555, partial [Bifidobacteriaceae bacterium]|nr:hypothetical protein [Bifidobacteriaceae bacterium]